MKITKNILFYLFLIIAMVIGVLYGINTDICNIGLSKLLNINCT